VEAKVGWHLGRQMQSGNDDGEDEREQDAPNHRHRATGAVNSQQTGHDGNDTEDEDHPDPRFAAVHDCADDFGG